VYYRNQLNKAYTYKFDATLHFYTYGDLGIDLRIKKEMQKAGDNWKQRDLETTLKFAPTKASSTFFTAKDVIVSEEMPTAESVSHNAAEKNLPKPKTVVNKKTSKQNQPAPELPTPKNKPNPPHPITRWLKATYLGKHNGNITWRKVFVWAFTIAIIIAITGTILMIPGVLPAGMAATGIATVLQGLSAVIALASTNMLAFAAITAATVFTLGSTMAGIAFAALRCSAETVEGEDVGYDLSDENAVITANQTLLIMSVGVGVILAIVFTILLFVPGTQLPLGGLLALITTGLTHAAALTSLPALLGATFGTTLLTIGVTATIVGACVKAAAHTINKIRGISYDTREDDDESSYEDPYGRHVSKEERLFHKKYPIGRRFFHKASPEAKHSPTDTAHTTLHSASHGYRLSQQPPINSHSPIHTPATHT